MVTTPATSTADQTTEDSLRDPRPVLVYLQKGEALGDSVIHVATYRAARLAFPRHRIVGLFSHPSMYATKTMSPITSQFLDEVLTMQPINRGPLPLARVLA